MGQILTITPTDETKKLWLDSGLGEQHKEEISAADILIVPEKNFREGIEYVFFQDTIKLLNYLKTELNGTLIIDLCASDEEYLEIALHSHTYRISKLFVGWVAAPIVIGLLTNYIYDELKAKPSDTVELSVVIENQDCKSFEFKFNGEAKDLNQLADKVGQMARDCKAASESGHKNGPSKKS